MPNQKWDSWPVKNGFDLLIYDRNSEYAKEMGNQTEKFLSKNVFWQELKIWGNNTLTFKRAGGWI